MESPRPVPSSHRLGGEKRIGPLGYQFSGDMPDPCIRNANDDIITRLKAFMMCGVGFGELGVCR